MTATSDVTSSEHFVPVGDGARLHVIERRPSVARGPARALLMIPATLTTNALYDARVDGDPSYNVLDRAARAGFCAFSVSYEGYGTSTPAADGADVTFERSLEQMGRVVEWVRSRLDVASVDVLGTSVGSSLAMALGGVGSPVDPRHIGHVVLTATVYRRFSELVTTQAFTPEFEAHLRGLPHGVVETEAPFYALVTSEVEEPVRRWVEQTLPDRYATGPTLAAFDLPTFDATGGRAPALLVWGSRDPVTTRADMDQLVQEYGGAMRLLVIPDGGHSPFLEPRRDLFWSEVLAFLEEPRRSA